MLQGSQLCGTETFFCNPPSLEEYLELGDEDELVRQFGCAGECANECASGNSASY